MASYTTNYFKNMIVKNIFGSGDPVLPSSYFIGLSTSTPTLAGGSVTEPSGNGYARVQIERSASSFTYNNGMASNANNISFPTSTGSWGVCTHYVIFSEATGGNLLMYGTLNNSRTIEADTTVYLPQGQVQFSIVDVTV